MSSERQTLASLLARRLLQLPLIVLAVYTVTFLLAWSIPGNPLENPEGRRPPEEIVEAMKQQYKLIAANTGQHILAKQQMTNTLCKCCQQRIAYLGPQPVINGLEMINIQCTHRQWQLPVFGMLDRFLNQLGE